MEYALTKHQAKPEGRATPEERRLECFRQIQSDASVNIETNITAALYNISIYGGKKATITLVEARTIVKMQQQKTFALLKEANIERCANLQKIEIVSTREIYVQRGNLRLLDGIKALKENSYLKLKFFFKKRSIEKGHSLDMLPHRTFPN
jgi:hypothetical protein